MFFLKPNLKNTKETVSRQDLEHTVIKKGVHSGELSTIISDEEFVVIGGFDNKISVWKIFGCQMINEILLPHEPVKGNTSSKNLFSSSESLLEKDKRHISHICFINMPSP